METGYNRNKGMEPLIFESECWDANEWRIICRLFGDLPPMDTTRIVLSEYMFEYFIKDSKKMPPRYIALELRELADMHRNSKVMGYTVDVMDAAADAIERLADACDDVPPMIK